MNQLRKLLFDAMQLELQATGISTPWIVLCGYLFYEVNFYMIFYIYFFDLSDLFFRMFPPATIQAIAAILSASAKDAVDEMVLGANRLPSIAFCDNPVSFGGRYVSKGGGQHVVVGPQVRPHRVGFGGVCVVDQHGYSRHARQYTPDRHAAQCR